MLKKKIQDALNKQIAMEEYAARSYLNLAIWADQSGFEGTAKFFYAQTEEEREHMHKIIQFVLQAGGKPIISDYGEPLPQGKSFKSLFSIHNQTYINFKCQKKKKNIACENIFY